MSEYVEDRTAFGAGAPSAEALNNFGQRQFVIDHGSERQIRALHVLLQRFGLAEGAGKSVENKSLTAIEAVASLTDHLPYGGIGYESAPPHVSHRRSHGRCLLIGSSASRCSE